MNVSKIKLGVVRKIRTADFEQLDVSVEIEEEIKWENEEERKEKTDNVNNHLKEDFQKTYNSVVESIGVKRTIGVAEVKNGKEVRKASVHTDKKPDDFEW